MEKELTINLPEGFVEMVSKRHYGTPHTHEEISKVFYVLTKAYERNKKYQEKEKKLLEVEWEELKVEDNFGTSIFYNAHARLDRYRLIIKETHRLMFHILTQFDGNYGQVFDRFKVIDEEEIYADFKSKYITGSTQKTESGGKAR